MAFHDILNLKTTTEPQLAVNLVGLKCHTPRKIRLSGRLHHTALPAAIGLWKKVKRAYRFGTEMGRNFPDI